MAVYEFPTSFGQRRMWLLAQMDPGEPAYNIAWALWLDGPLDVSALQQAWDAALVRHEALRTTFKNESGVPVQVIEDEPTPQPLLVTSVEQLPAGEREPAARALILDVARIPFDLATGPLVRAALVRLSPEAHVLAMVMHHIVADGWSFRILFDELSADYEAISRGGGPATAEPPIQYADFAIWQLEHAEDGGYALAERFWRSELADAPQALPLPADEPYPARQTFAAGGIDATIDASLTDRLRRFAAQHGTTHVRRPAGRVRGRARPAYRPRRPADRGADGCPYPAGDRVGRRAVHEHRHDPDPDRPGRDAPRPGAVCPHRDRAGASESGAADPPGWSSWPSPTAIRRG